MKKLLVLLILTVLVGGTSVGAVEMSPEAIPGATTIDVDRAVDLFEQRAVFVDPRKQSDFDAGHIPGAVHLDVAGQSTELTEAALLSALGSKDAPVVFYCNGVTCMRSPQAVMKAVGWSFKNVYYFRTGFPAWQNEGLPVE